MLHQSDAATQKYLLAEMARHRIKSDETGPLALKFAGEDSSFVPTAIEMLSTRSGVSSDALPLFARVARSAEFSAATRARAIGALQRTSDSAAQEAAIEGLVSAAQQG